MKTAATIIFGALLAGCAVPYTPAPVATNFPTSTQYTLQAASHWRAIAEHLEQHLAQEMKGRPQRPFYLAEPGPDAPPFQRALAVQLTSALVKDGYVVSRAPAGSLKVEIDVQALTFGPDRQQYRYKGIVVPIGDGLWAQAADSADIADGKWAQGMAAPAVVATPSSRAGGGQSNHESRFTVGATPRTELLVTVSVSDQYRYYARTAAAYYVSETDRRLYGVSDDARNEKLSKTYTVRGDK
ncbi:MAG: hypothetical protein V4724_11775 [Pseudomonadota bacterium]